MSNESNASAEAKPSQLVSKKCDSAEDADVIFVSSDDVLFYVHRKNLESNATAFPSAEFETRGEQVPLTEHSSTLELLFQYVYPQRRPVIEFMPFEDLAPLSEAAEKYEIFSAMEVCKMRMKQIVPGHPVEIFNYASKHGYDDILGVAAPFLLDIPLEEIVATLSPRLVVPWVCYWKSWTRMAFEAIKGLPEPYYMSGNQLRCRQCGTSCSVGSHLLIFAQILENLGEKRSLVAMEGSCENVIFPCSHGAQSKAVLRTRLGDALRNAPCFDDFL